MTRYRISFTVLAVIVVALLAALAPSADATGIDDDPTLPDCNYANTVAGVACNRPVRFVDNIPDALEDAAFNDTFTYRDGRRFQVECSHFGDIETLCILGGELFPDPGPTPTPTPVPELSCGVGEVPVTNNGVARCVPPNENVPGACPVGRVDQGVVNGVRVCSVPTAVPSFTG